jgi:hypothetical protein
VNTRRPASAAHRPKGGVDLDQRASGRGNNDRAAATAQIEWDTCQRTQARTYAASGIVLAVLGEFAMISVGRQPAPMPLEKKS